MIEVVQLLPYVTISEKNLRQENYADNFHFCFSNSMGRIQVYNLCRVARKEVRL
jgi:hypothetical protein